MARNIVVCCDGTGNEVEADESNVFRLARMLVRDGKQLVYYDPGVGTQGAPTLDFASRQELLKMLGMGLGIGVFDRVASAYRFVMATYEPGDRLFVFGFSRGAYIARALAGVIAKIGLLDPLNGNLVPYAVKLYSAPGNAPVVGHFRGAFVRERPHIDFLGLWDTVKSVYQFDPRRASFTRVSLPLTFDNARVRVVRHAVALDECRRFYRTNMWTEESAFSDDQDVRQVWFAGVHSDIGGSYPEAEAGLSKIALVWMVREARAAGVRIDEDRYDAIVPATPRDGVSAPDHRAPVHRSLRGLWWLLEAFPSFPFGRRRAVPAGALVHRSVERRMRDVAGYAPRLPGDHEFVD